MPWEDDIQLDKYYKTDYFFEKGEDGEWNIKKYKRKCEYCGQTTCDRMEYWKDLDLDYNEMFHDESKMNNEKRKFMYKSHSTFYRGVRTSLRWYGQIFLQMLPVSYAKP